MSTLSNIVSVFQKKFVRFSKQCAYLFLEDGMHETDHILYAQLHQKACKIAAYLQEKKLLGQRVLLLYPTGIAFIESFLGCLYAGVVAVPIQCPKLNEFETYKELLKTIALDADIAGIFTSASYVPLAKACMAELGLAKKIWVAETAHVPMEYAAAYVKPEIDDQAIAYLQYTSGSTSTPKAAMISHGNLLHSLKYTGKIWHYSAKSITLTWAPHTHVYGLVCGLLLPIFHGGLAILMPPAAFIQRPIVWLAAISKYKVTHSGCPNFGYDLCIRDISAEQLNDINLQTWVVAVNGGEQVQYATFTSFCERFAPYGFQPNHFCSAYGMSELSGAIASSLYQQVPKHFHLLYEGLKNNEVLLAAEHLPHRTFVGSGHLLPGLHAAVVDPQTLLPVQDGQIGEIWLSGKSVVSGYWHREKETQAVFHARLKGSTRSYFRTGDLGFIKENELCLVGRLKELIVQYGKKYYPLDIEMTVKTAVKPLAESGARVIFSVLHEHQEVIVLIEEVKSLLNNATFEDLVSAARHAVMRDHGIDLFEIVIVKEHSIPKTTSGKLQRKLCEQQYLANQLNIVARYAKSQQDSKALLIELVASVLKLKTNQIDFNAPFSQYGFDSIHVIRLTSLINENFHLNLTPAVLFNYTHLAAFYADVIDVINDSQEHLKKQKIDSCAIENTAAHDHSQSVNQHDIAIIGMSALFPGAADLETFWQNMLAGKDAISEIPQARWDWRAYDERIKWGGLIENIAEFDAHFFNISPREAELIDPQQRLFLQTAWHAIEDAGYSTSSLSEVKTGLFVGVFTNDYAELLQKHEITDAYITTGLTHSILANRVSYLLNLTGPSEAIDTACSSSLVAMHHAVLAILHGDCELAIVGGANALLSPTSYLAASKAGMLSEDGRCKTFDKKANGYVRGEGVAAILLKRLDQALSDGDHIYGVIKGSAVNHGGHVNSITVPNPLAQAEVVVAACQRANVPIENINYIETHGTGTALGDPIEINGLKKAFNMLKELQNKDHLGKGFCGLGSVKTHIGHLEAAAGIAGVIKVLLAMQYGKMPANLHFSALNPYIELDDSPFYICNSNRDWPRLKDEHGDDILRCAGVSSFGFGGTNAHILLQEAPVVKRDRRSLLADSYVLTLSAKTTLALQYRISELLHWLQRQPQKPMLADLCYTANSGRDHFDKRCLMVVHSIEELQATLELVLLQQPVKNFYTNTNDIHQAGVSEPIDNELVKRYLQGESINWEAIHQGEKKRIAIPTYPFAKDYYWIPSSVPDKKILNAHANVDQQLSRIQQDIIHYVAEILKENPHHIKLTTALSEQGFDSIAFTELGLSLQEYFGIELKPTVFFTYHSIAELAQHLAESYSTALSKLYGSSADERLDQPIKRTSTLFQADSTPAKQDTLSDSIAIIGMQGIFPQSKDVNALWEHLVLGDELITEVPVERWNWRDYVGDAKNDTSKTNSKWGGFIPGVEQFDAEFFNISAREANLMDPQQRLMLMTAWRAIEDAGYDPFSLSEQITGVFVGAEFSDYQTLISKKNALFHGHVATGNAQTMLANRISYFLNLHGPSEVIDTACSSSLVALHRAVQAIKCGECDIAIAGGVSIILDPHIFVMTTQLGALSADGRCKTFDKQANGYVKGEGVVALLLKSLNAAERDGDHVYAVIRGSAVQHGGKAQSLTAPNVKAQSQLLIKAYREANINPETISYIEAHGTGTVLGDPIEIEGLKQAFNQLSIHKHVNPYCGIGSIKSNIGHLEPASGIAGVVKVILAMQHNKIPGNLYFNELNPIIELTNSPFYIVSQTTAWSRLKDESGSEIPRRAGVNSFGFGGTNAHVILEEHIPQSACLSDFNQAKPAYLLTISAKHEHSFKQKLIDLSEWLKLNISTTNLASLCFTLNTGRTHFDYRCAIVVSSLDELLNSLRALINNESCADCIINKEPVANYYSPLFDEIYQATFAVIKNDKQVSHEIYRRKLLLLGDLYTRRYLIDWDVLHAGESKQHLCGLPSYPFLTKQYWFDAELISTALNNVLPIAIQPIVGDLLAKQPADLTTFTVQYLKNIFAEKLTIVPEKIAIDATYELYGIDSLLNIEIINRLQKDFGALPKTLLYEKNKIKDLAAYFQENFTAVLQTLWAASHQANAQLTENILNKNIPLHADLSSLHTQEIQTPLGGEDIAIIGLTGIYPMAKDINEFWDHLVEGKNCITDIPSSRWNYKDYPVSVGGEEKYYKYGGFISDVDQFDPLFFNLSPRDAELMDPQERLFMQSAWAVLEDAGYTRKGLEHHFNNQVGVFVGVSHHFYPLFIAEEWFKGHRLPLGIQLFSIANRVSYFMNLTGPSFVVDTACSSSLAAIHMACESIMRGECRLAIAGGINLSLHPCKYHMLGSYGFMSSEGRCASFAAGGSGYVPAEGVGSVLLKPLSLAVKDNDHIYGVIKSSSINHDGKTSGYTVPNPNAQAALIKNALSKAKINPRTISYVEAHGTGTVLGDPIEIRGLQNAFEVYTQDKQFCAIGSVKSNIGHLEAAAGIAQLTKVLLQMQHKQLVPSIHAETLNPHIDFLQTPFYVQRELTDWQPRNGEVRRAGISSFGAGGTNVHVIVEEFIQPSLAKSLSQPCPWLFILSAMNAERLLDYAKKMHEYFLAEKKKYAREDDINTWLTQAMYTLQVGREQMSARLAIRAYSYEDLLKKLKAYLDNTHQAMQEVWMKVNHIAVDDQLVTINGLQDESLIEQWVSGANIAWQALYDNMCLQKISMPTYPFAKRRCWVPVESDLPSHTQSASLAIIPKAAGLILDEVVEQIQSLLSGLLNLEIKEIDPELTFDRYGVDSIVGINFVVLLNQHYKNFMTPMDLYRYPTIMQLAEYIVNTYQPITVSQTELDDEKQFLSDIAHLNNQEISQLLEQELMGLEKLM